MRALRAPSSAGLRAAAAGVTLALATAMAAPAPVAAQPRDPVVWQPLDPRNPEHAAILAWHRALLDNDFPAYLHATTPIPGLDERARQTMFDHERATTPPTLMIAVTPTSTNPNGSRSYAVAGCMKAYGDPDDLRMVALVTPLEREGRWKVSASGFGTPWNRTIRACPVK